MMRFNRQAAGDGSLRGRRFVALAATQTQIGRAYFKQAIAVAKPLGVVQQVADPRS
jgi:hypothetical protein